MCALFSAVHYFICLLSLLESTICSIFSHNFYSFIVYFSFCILTWWMTLKKSQRNLARWVFYIFVLFICCIDLRRDKKSYKSDYVKSGEKRRSENEVEKVHCLNEMATSLPNLLYAKMAIALLNQHQGKNIFWPSNLYTIIIVTKIKGKSFLHFYEGNFSLSLKEVETNYGRKEPIVRKGVPAPLP